MRIALGNTGCQHSDSYPTTTKLSELNNTWLTDYSLVFRLFLTIISQGTTSGFHQRFLRNPTSTVSSHFPVVSLFSTTILSR